MSDNAPVDDLGKLIHLIESRALPLLERIAIALERAPGTAGDTQTAQARLSTADDLRDRINAAQAANDADSAMSLRDELAKVVDAEALKEVDRPMVKWLLTLIHRRLRTGSIRPDLVELATRVGDRFGGTTEGASLNASLPTLRRSAGLCPRCAEPYKGIADACPKCLAAAGPELTIVVEEEEEEPTGEPVDLNNERLWEEP